MSRVSRDAWNDRRKALRRFEGRAPPPSRRELESRLAWLRDALALARKLDRLEPLPVDSPEIREYRRTIRERLARIRV